MSHDFRRYYFDVADEEFEGMTHDIKRKVAKFAIAGLVQTSKHVS